MKKTLGFFYIFLFFVAVFSHLCYSAAKKRPSTCPKGFEVGEIVKDLFTLKDFVQVMVDLKIYSTLDLVKAKRDGDFPEEVPDKPLKTYQELKGQWSVLWNAVHARRLSQGEDVAKRRKLTDGELRTLMAEVSESLNRKEALELEEDSSVEQRAQNVEQRAQNVGQRAQNVGQKAQNVGQKAQNVGQKAQNVGQNIDNQKKTPFEAKNRRNKKKNRPVGGGWKVSLQSERESSLQSEREGSLQSERERRVLSLIEENPQIQIRELSEQIEVTRRLVDKIISQLKEEGHLVRVGGTSQHGYWKVFKKGEKASADVVSLQSERKRRLLSLMEENHQIQIRELSEHLQVSERLVDKTIAYLKKEGRLVRVGGVSQHGYWKVFKEGEKASADVVSLQSERERRVLSLIEENPQIQIRELSEQIEVTRRLVDKIISQLKEEGHLVRVGGTSQHGYWKVFKKGEKASADVVSLQSERKRRLLSLMEENHQIKMSELSEQIEVSMSEVGKIISQLKKEGRLVRVGGSSQHGYWKVFKKGEKASADVVSLQSERDRRVLSLMEENPQIKIRELFEHLQVSESMVNKIISRLKKEGRLVRVGGTSQKGYWEVL